MTLKGVRDFLLKVVLAGFAARYSLTRGTFHDGLEARPMNAWEREKLAWDAFAIHTNTCPICSHERPVYPLCDEGLRLEKAWGLADAVAQRAEQEADEKADQLGDCADWAPFIDDHADDWKPGR